jgi:hypothetical protein
MHSELVAWVLVLSWKDLLQEAAWIIGGLVGLFTVTIAIYQLWASTKLRAADLRWRRVSGARDILGEIHHHELGSRAVMMLDWHNGEHKYEVEEGHKTEISYSDVLVALKKDQSACVDEKSTYIRDCFDWFFYYIDRIEFYLQTELILFADVASVFKPYAEIIQKDWSVYERFLVSCRYDDARKFWIRFGGTLG